MKSAAQRRLRVLLIAEACNPEWTSVPLVAYYWYRALRELVDVTLVTQVRNKGGFARQDPDANVVFINSELLAAPLHRFAKYVRGAKESGSGAGNAYALPAYYYFEYLIWKQFGRQISCGDFDVIHRLTPLSPTFPSPIACWSPVPFVIGPVNGNLPWPPGTADIQRNERSWPKWIRSAYRAAPYWRETFLRAAAIVLATKRVGCELPSAKGPRVVIPENGVDVARFYPYERPKACERAFSILFVGRLVPLKQVKILVEVVRRLRSAARSVKLTVVGDGPEKARIIEQATRLGVMKNVELVGWVAHERLRKYYCSASLLALPSVHESGGGVLLEAMACGLPCIVADYGGPMDIVTDEVGMRIQINDDARMSDDFTLAIQRLMDDPALLRRMSEESLKSVHNRWRWGCKARHMLAVYSHVSGLSGNSPKCVG